jgi:hypothetical protein
MFGSDRQERHRSHASLAMLVNSLALLSSMAFDSLLCVSFWTYLKQGPQLEEPAFETTVMAEGMGRAILMVTVVIVAVLNVVTLILVVANAAAARRIRDDPRDAIANVVVSFTFVWVIIRLGLSTIAIGHPIGLVFPLIASVACVFTSSD